LLRSAAIEALAACGAHPELRFTAFDHDDQIDRAVAEALANYTRLTAEELLELFPPRWPDPALFEGCKQVAINPFEGFGSCRERGFVNRFPGAKTLA